MSGLVRATTDNIRQRIFTVRGLQGFQLTKKEKNELFVNCDRFKNLKHSTVLSPNYRKIVLKDADRRKYK